MELPDDVVRMIKEYSMPLTRPDWRNLHKMTFTNYLLSYDTQYRMRSHYINNVFSDTHYVRMFAWALFLEN